MKTSTLRIPHQANKYTNTIPKPKKKRVVSDLPPYVLIFLSNHKKSGYIPPTPFAPDHREGHVVLHGTTSRRGM